MAGASHDAKKLLQDSNGWYHKQLISIDIDDREPWSNSVRLAKWHQSTTFPRSPFRDCEICWPCWWNANPHLNTSMLEVVYQCVHFDHKQWLNSDCWCSQNHLNVLSFQLMWSDTSDKLCKLLLLWTSNFVGIKRPSTSTSSTTSFRCSSTR